MSTGQANRRTRRRKRKRARCAVAAYRRALRLAERERKALRARLDLLQALTPPCEANSATVMVRGGARRR